MKIDSREFCSLSSDSKFQRWLHRISYDLYKELLSHLRKAEGCSSNKAKMVEILRTLLDDTILSQQLQDFLRSTYPHVIKESNLPKVAVNYAAQNRHKVFSHYDPTLATFPRRLIITDVDASQVGKPLETMARQFCARHAASEHIIIDDRAYVEYLPMEYADARDKIPDKNWQVRTYRTG